MCGLTGRVGPISEGQWGSEYRLLSALLVAAEARGIDAAGFMAVCQTYKRPSVERIVTDKQPIKASEFVTGNMAWRSLRHRRSPVVLCHTRWGTHGSSNNPENLHPFAGDDGLYVLHNGVIKNHRELADKHGLDLRGECDSEVIVRMLEKSPNNIGMGLKNSLKAIEGSAAILVHKNGLVWLARNNANPLWLARFKGQRACWIASTAAIFINAVKAARGEGSLRQLDMLLPVAPNTVHLILQDGRILAQ
jgi:glucosamine 6-phosphate synthetase-like amidotransferase/phosphosugar isomerase protein